MGRSRSWGVKEESLVGAESVGNKPSDDRVYEPYSPECVEYKFYELRLLVILRSWALYPWESADSSSSSTIFRPSIISKVKRTMPLSLPLCST